MATYTGTPFQTYASGGRTGGGLTTNEPSYREKILNALAYVNGIETPLLNVLAREYERNTLYSWIMGNITFDRTTIPADVEGKLHTALGDQSTRARVRAWNGIHIHSKDVVVTDIQRHMDEVGVPDEYQHQVWEQMLSMMVEFENILMWSAYVSGTEGTFAAPGTAPRTHGLAPWAIWTGKTGGTVTIAGQEIPNEYSAIYHLGAGTDMTRRQLNDNLLEPFWAQGGEIDHSLCFVGTKVKSVISQYAMIYNGSGATLSSTPLNDRNIPAQAARLVDKLDIYEGDWGRLFVIKNRNMSNPTLPEYTSPGGNITIDPTKSMVGFEPRYAAINVFEAPNHVPLAKLGSTSQGYVEAVMGIIQRNPRSMFFGSALAA